MAIFFCPVCERGVMKHQLRGLTCSEACRRKKDEARYVVKRRLTMAQAAYLAGLVDGEGTLSIRRTKTGSLRTVFTIAQANRLYLEGMRDEIGNGTIEAKKIRPRQKPMFVLRFNGSQTRWILPQLIPFLRLKRKHGEIVLDYFESVDQGHRQNHATREQLSQKIMSLNARGQPEDPTRSLDN